MLPIYVGYNNEHYLPDLRGKYKDYATKELEYLGFVVDPIDKQFSDDHIPGTVINMSPRAFTKVKEGRIIKLTIASHRKDVFIIDFIDMTLRNAKLELERLGLELDTVMYEFNIDYEEDKITYQSPKPPHLVRPGTKVVFMVSKGNPPDYYKVPDLVNLSLKRAEQLLNQAGLHLGDIEYEYQPSYISNTVLEQNLTAGMRVSFPTRVNLTISTDKKDF